MKEEEDTTSGEYLLPPGKTAIASQPSYSYDDNTKFIESVKKNSNLVQEYIGTTDQGRKIHQFIIKPKPSVEKIKTIVLVFRVHPYETASNYCVEGIVESFA